MILKNGFSFVVLTLVLTISASVFAAEPEKDGRCLAEVKKLCPNLTMKDGLGKCLRAHKDEFSKECQEKVEEKKAELKASFKDCKDDVKKVCAGVERGEGRIIKCLKENAEKLSSACKAHVEKAPNI